MNADQKKRIAHEISNWKNACNCRAVQLAGDRMAALLQELADGYDAPDVLSATNPSQISSSAELPAWENGDDPLIAGGLISRGVVDFASLGIWYGKPAPEAEPVAYVTGYYAGYLSIATVDGRVLPAGTALYAAPPAPSVPDGWRPFLTDVITAAGLLEHGKRDKGLAGRIGKFAFAAMRAAPTPAEPSADVARDAERLDWLLRNLPGVVLRYCVGVLSDTSDGKEFRDAIDAAIERQGGE